MPGGGETAGRFTPGTVWGPAPGLAGLGAGAVLGALGGGGIGGRGNDVRGDSTTSLVDLLTTRR